MNLNIHLLADKKKLLNTRTQDKTIDSRLTSIRSLLQVTKRKKTELVENVTEKSTVIEHLYSTR